MGDGRREMGGGRWEMSDGEMLIRRFLVLLRYDDDPNHSSKQEEAGHLEGQHILGEQTVAEGLGRACEWNADTIADRVF